MISLIPQPKALSLMLMPLRDPKKLNKNYKKY
jgi:hypothetical protein